MVTTSTTQMVTTNVYNQLLWLVTTGHFTMICKYRVRKMDATFGRNLQKLELTFRQLDTTLNSEHIGSGKWKPLFGAIWLLIWLQTGCYCGTKYCYYSYITGYHKWEQLTTSSGCNWLLHYDLHIQGQENGSYFLAHPTNWQIDNWLLYMGLHI